MEQKQDPEEHPYTKRHDSSHQFTCTSKSVWRGVWVCLLWKMDQGGEQLRSPLSSHERGSTTICCGNPPLETCPPGSEELVFTITKTILGPKDWPYEEDYEEDYSYADLPSLQRRNPYLPLDDDEYNGHIAVAGSVQLPGEETPQEYIAEIYDSAYYPINWDMECRKADDGIEPDCVIDAYNELWWWCQIDHGELQPHGVPIKKDGTAVPYFERMTDGAAVMTGESGGGGIVVA
ncbi:hypothetical protein QC764_206484 [Podospora pseudoanserina]|uniref:Uncharacterized protein n=1 Tax=Podospora pseudoanserina TaxID=2609844 RepID=A0ABR0IHV1_9PEZI|nr:hypothetical protein QC764_206484 [Podospora pseudoanserina]